MRNDPDARPSSTDRRDAFGAFRREHAGMLAVLDELERGLRDRTGAFGESGARESIARVLAPFAEHMAAEDDVLYPAVRTAFPAGRPTLESLHADHTELRLMLGSITAGLAAAPSAGRDEQLRVVLRDFIDLLRLHIHREESVVFDVASRVLTNPEAEELARRVGSPSPRNLPGAEGPGSTKGTAA